MESSHEVRAAWTDLLERFFEAPSSRECAEHGLMWFGKWVSCEKDWALLERRISESLPRVLALRELNPQIFQTLAPNDKEILTAMTSGLEPTDHLLQLELGLNQLEVSILTRIVRHSDSWRIAAVLDAHEVATRFFPLQHESRAPLGSAITVVDAPDRA